MEWHYLFLYILPDGDDFLSGDRVSYMMMVMLLIFFVLVPLVLFGMAGIQKSRYQLIIKQGIIGVGKVVQETHIANLSDGGEQLNCVFLFKNCQGVIRKQAFVRLQLPTEFEQKRYLMDHKQQSKTYPQEKFIRYPKIGEEFEFLYLADNDNEFLILNEGKSEFVHHLTEERIAQYQRIQDEQQFIEKVCAELENKDSH